MEYEYLVRDVKFGKTYRFEKWCDLYSFVTWEELQKAVDEETELSATAVPAEENGLEKSSDMAGWAVVDDGGDYGML